MFSGILFNEGSISGIPKLFLKGQTVNSLGFVGHIVSVTTSQLCSLAWKQP